MPLQEEAAGSHGRAGPLHQHPTARECHLLQADTDHRLGAGTERYVGVGEGSTDDMGQDGNTGIGLGWTLVCGARRRGQFGRGIIKVHVVLWLVCVLYQARQAGLELLFLIILNSHVSC